MIDTILQPGIQFVLAMGIVGSIILLLHQKINIHKNHKMVICIIGLIGIYHYVILPIIFVHEFGGYEGYDYRVLFHDDNQEPTYSNIILRKDKYSTMETISSLVDFIKQRHNLTTVEILQKSMDLKDKQRIHTLSSTIDA